MGAAEISALGALRKGVFVAVRKGVVALGVLWAKGQPACGRRFAGGGRIREDGLRGLE